MIKLYNFTVFKEYIKKLTLYNKLIKLKPLWISHLSILFLLIFEISAIIDVFILHNEEPSADYIIDFPLAIKLSHFFAFLFLGILINLMYGFQIVIKIYLKKTFIVHNKFLLNNTIYHFFWVLTNYFTIFLAICTLPTVINMIKGWLEWFYYTIFK